MLRIKVGLPESDQKQCGLTVLRFEPIYAAHSDLFGNIAVLVLCCWLLLLTRCCPLALEGFILHLLQLSTHPFVSSVSCSAPGSLWVTGRMSLACIKNHFPTCPHFLCRHSLLLDLPFPTFAFLQGDAGDCPCDKDNHRCLGQWFSSQNLGFLRFSEISEVEG